MFKKAGKSFSGRLKLSYVIIILIPVLCLGGFIFYSSYYYVKQQKLKESANMVRRNEIYLDNLAEQCENSLKYLAGSYTLQEFLQMDENQFIEVNQAARNISPLLYNIQLSNQNYKGIKVYVDKQFNILEDIIKNSDAVEETDWYRSVISSAGVYWWFEDNMLFIGKKIVIPYPKQVVGVIRVELKEESLESCFDMFQEMPVRIVLIDNNGVHHTYMDSLDRNERIGFEGTNEIGNTGWLVRYQIAEEFYGQNVWEQLWIPMLVLCAVLISVWICIHLISKELVRDLKVLVEEVDEVHKGNFDVEILTADTEEINLLADSVRIMLSTIKQLIRQVYEKEIERQNLELNLLQSKISPHFLYNNLSAINWMAIECGEEKISEIVTEMATFYRTALNKGNNIDKLSVEIENIKAYINLQLISHENSFQVEYEIDQELLTCVIPIFILQPLVENAIEHGIDQLPIGQGRLKITARRSKDRIYLCVHDNGNSLYEKLGESVLPEEEYGYGTSNVHRRIQLLYGTQYGLIIRADESGTTSILRVSRWNEQSEEGVT